MMPVYKVYIDSLTRKFTCDFEMLEKENFYVFVSIFTQKISIIPSDKRIIFLVINLSFK